MGCQERDWSLSLLNLTLSKYELVGGDFGGLNLKFLPLQSQNLLYTIYSQITLIVKCIAHLVPIKLLFGPFHQWHLLVERMQLILCLLPAWNLIGRDILAYKDLTLITVPAGLLRHRSYVDSSNSSSKTCTMSKTLVQMSLGLGWLSSFWRYMIDGCVSWQDMGFIPIWHCYNIGCCQAVQLDMLLMVFSNFCQYI